MDDTELAEIEKRANDATTGPWEHHVGDSERGEPWHSVIWHDARLQFGYDNICNGLPEEDAAFIAHAREDVPALLAALRGERVRASQLADAIRDIDAHATPLGEDDDGFVTTGYLISVGSLHRALGLAVQVSSTQEADQ